MQLKIPVIGILRGISADQFGPLMQAAFAAGLQAIEVTMNTPGAAGIITAHRNKDIPIIAGALTPTEVYRAWEAGAVMVKVFPCRSLGGPRYIRELRGPFEHIPLVAVGGVTIENGREYLQAGASALGTGISLFGEQEVKAGDWGAVRKNVEAFIRRCCMEQKGKTYGSVL
jgi:2-dehydro-3-deoxyphosphogluconate aldolase/(4S)-4-hydroxy-2-oxoglutarate aldolase